MVSGPTEPHGSPFFAGLEARAVIVEPSGNHVYVANHAVSNISAYSINRPTGTLTQLFGSPFPTGFQAKTFVTNRTGSYLYVGYGGGISVYSIDALTGFLTPVLGSPFTAETVNMIAIAPSGEFLYTANGSSDSISGYRITQETGALTPLDGSPFSSTATTPSKLVVVGYSN